MTESIKLTYNKMSKVRMKMKIWMNWQKMEILMTMKMTNSGRSNMTIITKVHCQLLTKLSNSNKPFNWYNPNRMISTTLSSKQSHNKISSTSQKLSSKQRLLLTIKSHHDLPMKCFNPNKYLDSMSLHDMVSLYLFSLSQFNNYILMIKT